MAEAGLAYLASADAGSIPAEVQADCLRRLERVESMHTAARSSVLGAFHAQRGFEDDGQATARSWLRWQTRITVGAAAGATAWVRRLAAHPQVRASLARGEVSASWARQICDWVQRLPEHTRTAAERILLAAAAAGAELADLGRLAEELHDRCAPPDGDGDRDGFGDRSVRLDLHFRGAGRLEGDLTPQCAAAVAAVLEALGKRAGPEDTRTKWQRDHDALEEACRRLVSSGCLPDRAGQPTQIQLHMTLAQLLAMSGPRQAADRAEPEPGSPARNPGVARPDVNGAVPSSPGVGVVPGPLAGPGYECDATIVPIVSGQVDPEELARQAALPGHGAPGTGAWIPADEGAQVEDQRAGPPGPGGVDDDGAVAGGARAARAVQEILLGRAVELLSGPAGLAGYLRRELLAGPASSVSLPLDVGAAAETIPAQLRRAVIARDRRCRFPGCVQPAMVCQPHHIVPRSEGGPTSLRGLLLLCGFHHLIAVHRWGWQITLSADGSVTAVSPDGSRTLRSHDPPPRAA